MNNLRILDSTARIPGLALGALIFVALNPVAAEPRYFLKDTTPSSTLATAGRPVPVVQDRASDRIVETLWQDRFGFVRIEMTESGSSSPNEHPAEYDTDEIRAALADLQLLQPDEKPESVFTENELGRISPYIAQALSRATPDQDIAFAIADKKDRKLMFFAKRKLTTGRIFKSEGALNVIFGSAHQDFEDQFRATGVLPEFVPGSRRARIQTGWDIRAKSMDPDYAAADRTDWLLLSPDEMVAAMSPDMTPATPRVVNTSTPATRQPAAPRAVRTASPATTRPSGTPTDRRPIHTEEDYKQMERRLEQSKRLWEKGLITQEEYDAKRKEIFDEL